MLREAYRERRSGGNLSGLDAHRIWMAEIVGVRHAIAIYCFYLALACDTNAR